jgi:hypothetical protein
MAYADLDDQERYGINPDSYAGIDDDKRKNALEANAVLMNGYFTSQFTLPLRAWGADVRMCNVALADETLLENRGYSPEGSGGESIGSRADRWRAWLRDVQNKRVRPPDIVDSTRQAATLEADEPDVSTSPPRGLS